MKYEFLDDVRRVICNGLPNGAVAVSATRWKYDISGGCEKPHYFTRIARPTMTHGHKDQVLGTGEHTTEVEMILPCRKCWRCRQRRRRLWLRRSVFEYERASRVWFVTLTVSPKNRSWLWTKALAKVHCDGKSIRGLSRSETTAYLWKVMSPEVTKYVKRVRDSMKHKLRILIVGEPHKNGFPHLHGLFYEQVEGDLTKRQILSKWELGKITEAELASSPAACGYVTKYILKEGGVRVRASLGFGGREGLSGLEPADLAKQSPIGDCNIAEKQSLEKHKDH